DEAVLAPLVLDRHAHVAEDGRPPLLYRHRLRRLAALEREELAEDPWIAACAAGNARGVGAGLREHPHRRLGGEQASRAPDGNPDRFLGAPDQLPIGPAAIHLRARPRMEAHRHGAALLAG